MIIKTDINSDGEMEWEFCTIFCAQRVIWSEVRTYIVTVYTRLSEVIQDLSSELVLDVTHFTVLDSHDS
jgi:hypothetical protein